MPISGIPGMLGNDFCSFEGAAGGGGFSESYKITCGIFGAPIGDDSE
jgi:hypothetical protein